MTDDDANRIHALDFLRGLAIMGIVLANWPAVALPWTALLNPFGGGPDGPLDLAVWTGQFLLVDGKFRALFALMFGASMLLVMESAELDGRDGSVAHWRRMLWLLPIGIAHHLLIWDGDILLPLALAGLVGTAFARLDTLTLIKWAFGLLALQWMINLAITLPAFWLRDVALAPGASAAAMAQWRGLSEALGGPGSAAVATQIALYRSDYAAIFSVRLGESGQALIDILLYVLPELLAFMALGMAMLKGGFLSGQWDAAQYRATWRRAYLVGLVPMIALAAWVLLSRDPLAAEVAGFAWSVPLRLPLVVAHAALAMDLAQRLPEGWLVIAIRAVGRLALSNYLLCSLAMTSLAYGYGAGLFGALDRLMLVGLSLAFWAAMLVWSWLWQRHWRYGPAEWIWRRLARVGL